MKQIIKKISSVCTAAICAASITIGGAAVVWADSEIDEQLEQGLTMMGQQLTEVIIPLSDEEITAYMESEDAFTAGAMESWKLAKEEVGEKNEDQSKAGEIEIEYSNGQYTVTVPVDFEKADANFVYVVDEKTVAPVSMTVDVQYSMGVTLQRAGLNTLMGIGTVFIMLIFLSFIISLFKFVPGLVEGKKKKEAAPAPAPVPAAVPVVEEETDDTELIAVIAAAIAASEGTSTDGFVVRSIRKINRKKR